MWDPSTSGTTADESPNWYTSACSLDFDTFDRRTPKNTRLRLPTRVLLPLAQARTVLSKQWIRVLMRSHHHLPPLPPLPLLLPLRNRKPNRMPNLEQTCL